MNSNSVHSVMVEKGFWDSTNFKKFDSFLAQKTFMQLGHAVDEYNEYLTEDVNALEEAADVCIVLLDLAGVHGVSLDPASLDERQLEAWFSPFATLFRAYRKQCVLDIFSIETIISNLMYENGKEPLLVAISEKMAINAQRPHFYGVAK